VLEGLVADQVRFFLLNKTLICRQQYGFMTSRSTATNLLCCDAAIAQYLNRKSSCDVVLLDFARAFDTVSHVILSRKLLEIGIQGKLHAWLINFLSDCSQYVNCRSASSAIVPVLSGVIQGSVLRPLLFTVFINDLPRVVSSSILLFADDVKIVSEASTDMQCDALQRDLEAVWEWSEEMRLPLCLQKCQCLHIGQSNRRRVYKVNGESLSVTDKCVNLGIIRTSSFSYDHIRSVISTASRAAGMIYRVFSLRSTVFLMNLFRTYVIPILEYVSPV
jgi:ribonuclease P/MRP protein subunit RPP40